MPRCPAQPRLPLLAHRERAPYGGRGACATCSTITTVYTCSERAAEDARRRSHSQDLRRFTCTKTTTCTKVVISTKVVCGLLQSIGRALVGSPSPIFRFGEKQPLEKRTAGPCRTRICEALVALPLLSSKPEILMSGDTTSRCIWTADYRTLNTCGGGLLSHRSASGGSTFRSNCSTSRGHTSKVNRSGGQGIDPDEVRRVQAIVDHRSLIAADEEYLAEQQMMMRPGPFHIMSDQDSSDSDAEYWVGGGGSGAATDRSRRPAAMRRTSAKRKQTSKPKPSAAAEVEVVEEPEPEPATFRSGVEERLLEHAFSIGGACTRVEAVPVDQPQPRSPVRTHPRPSARSCPCPRSPIS